MANLKTKVLSLIALTYSINSVAGMTVVTDDEVNDFVAHNDAKEMSLVNEIAITNIEPILTSKLDDGSSIEWKSNNKFEMFGSKMPLGFNDSGLIVKSFINKDNSFGKIDSPDVTLSSSDLPKWILSKYDTIKEAKEGLSNLNIVLDKNDLPLSYKLLDKNNEEITINIDNGDIKIS